MKLRAFVATAMFLVLTLPCGIAQSAGGGFAQGVGGGVTGSGPQGVIGSVISPGNAPASAPTMPYSADVVIISDRMLADGNHIHRETHGKVYRDSQGRMRTENELAVPVGAEPVNQVSITDPVQHVFIGLDTPTQTATISHFPEANRAVLNRVPAQQQPKVEMKHEDLGTQEIEGFLAYATSMTRTIPAGAEGNDQPLVVVHEGWVAPELGIAILIKDNDPRNGITERRLSNIQRGEPDPALFQVPADYKVKDNGTPQ